MQTGFNTKWNDSKSKINTFVTELAKKVLDLQEKENYASEKYEITTDIVQSLHTCPLNE